ncbi:Sodium:dicarboxylate symporter family [Popillia japonica]|uniref:Amino acid transporter n=1 Tax=Popillia japonica TaxID=7064 RepID=A0AAW1LBT0_POPJA
MKILQFIRANIITILTIISVFAGVAVGITLKQVKPQWTEREVKYVEFPGELFLRMLKSLIIPLLTASIICAVGTLDLSLSKKIALRSITYYGITTLMAVILGIILVVTIQPGANIKNKDFTATGSKTKPVLTQDTLLDLIRNLFPPNLIQATLAQYSTHLEPANDTAHPYFNESDYLTYTPTERYEGTTNVLGLVFFSIVFGIAMGMMREKAAPLIDFFQSLSDAMMVITGWVICLSPIGVFFLVTAKVVGASNLGVLIERLGMYFVTVMLGLTIHGFGTLSVLFFLATRKLPFKTIGQLAPVLVTAFGTASSSATMPLTIQTLDHIGVDPRVTRFVIPVGSTINMDGTALYEAVAALFIAQFRGRSFNFGNLVAVSITATFASIGAAGIPQAGLVTMLIGCWMVMVLDTLGLPSEDVSLILAVDWLLDRFRTTINVIGDSLGAVIVGHLSKNELKDLPVEDKMNADPHELTELTKGHITQVV